MEWRMSAAQAFIELPGSPNEPYPEGVPFRTVMSHGTMTVEAFAPHSTDRQQPHDQDELYVILSGRSGFTRSGERTECSAGDVILVPARMQHASVDFTDDFRTWVIFWGPQGGDD